jgi:hypothetical protein
MILGNKIESESRFKSMKSFRAVSSLHTLEGAGEWGAAWSAGDEHGPAVAAKPRRDPFHNRLKRVLQGGLGFAMVLPIALTVVFLPALVRVADCVKILKPRK